MIIIITVQKFHLRLYLGLCTYKHLNQLEDMRIQSNVCLIGAHFLNESQTLNSNNDWRASLGPGVPLGGVQRTYWYVQTRSLI